MPCLPGVQITPVAVHLQQLLVEALQEAVQSGSRGICDSVCQALVDVATLLSTLPPTVRVRLQCERLLQQRQPK